MLKQPTKILESNQANKGEDETRKKSVEDRDDLIFDLVKRRYDGYHQVDKVWI
jgi:hypothetical protein